MAVGGTDSHALRSLLGLRTSRPWVTRGGQVIAPQLRALWLHEYLNPATTLNAGFASAGGSFNTQGLNMGRDWAVLGTGLTWQANRHLSAFANYDVQTNANQTFNVGSGGLQWVW
ncbi:MAG: autotransporter outer membrane beta-barrel domain-containing protein [Planctomycetia bacterium]|nr:autotransporter outer membrane beta-barrel domain-containing protein [Planctomycetia bacterium]